MRATRNTIATGAALLIGALGLNPEQHQHESWIR